jgi:hypothetical protein
MDGTGTQWQRLENLDVEMNKVWRGVLNADSVPILNEDEKEWELNAEDYERTKWIGPPEEDWINEFVEFPDETRDKWDTGYWK